MISQKKILLVFGLLILAGLTLAACATTETIIQTVIVEGEAAPVAGAGDGEEACDNPYLGSCKLDGNGIPPDFFMDIHVRKAFNYCFDWDIYISEVLAGEAVQNVGVINPGLLGVDPEGDKYSFDPDKCAEEFALAYDGQLMETGFRLQIAYNAGNSDRLTIAQILQSNVNDVSENFQVEIVGLPWPALLAGIRASSFPIFISGWAEDIHDPHNWAQPFLVGTYATRQKLPDEMYVLLKDMVSAGVAGATDAERAEAYGAIQQWDFDNAIGIRLAVPTGRFYQQTWVEGYYYHPINALTARYYTLSKSAAAPDPTTLTYVSFGDLDTMDPAWNYENVGGDLMGNVYDSLVTYEGPDPLGYVPQLATSWEITDEGKTYTFTIREGVKFHEGQDLTPEDVAYTFQRAILQGGLFSPQFLFTEPFFGIGTYDVAELVDPELADDPEGLQAADPAALLAACEQVTSAIVADDAAGTVTMHLAQGWAPFLSTLAGSWGSVLDKGWSVENGAWDGDCSTWQNFYGIGSDNSPLRAVMNGTGPYILDHWTPGVETVLVANENYWRTAEVGSAWEGGPVGTAAIKTVVYLIVDEWSTRRAMLETGDADFVSVPRAFIDQLADMVAQECVFDLVAGVHVCGDLDPSKALIVWIGQPSTSRTDVFFVLNITH